ncbi:caspase family protein [Jiella marina]|uniref:caspase family protein n=1 Tax=Jiella sp. LLJ827 TaxID=2917712 RepID=UPI0021007419|nr:caspase family protein [Jiella sp. LLJ827]MCQ0988941.1 caspase family protein [Jiella sp. LLJ827]
MAIAAAAGGGPSSPDPASGDDASDGSQVAVATTRPDASSDLAETSAGPATDGRWELASDKTCAERREIIDRLGREMLMNFDRTELSVGEELTLSWGRGVFPEREPIFLMASFSEPVRLGGSTGFYGLLPEARAAYDIAWDKERTRAVIPLFGREAPASGTITVAPVFARNMTVKWTTVGYDGCAVHFAPEGAGEFAVRAKTAGNPKIVVNDPTDLGTPTDIITSPDGTRQIVVYEDRFRLIDTATGAELLERAGTDPAFSPTGRFVLLDTQDKRDHNGDDTSIINGLLLLSSLDGSKVIFTQHWSAAWHNEESLLIANWGGFGLTTIYDTTSGRQIVSDASMAACRICGFEIGKGFSIDLENNYLILSGESGFGKDATGGTLFASLSNAAQVRGSSSRIRAYAKAQAAVTSRVNLATIRDHSPVIDARPRQTERTTKGEDTPITTSIETSSDYQVANLQAQITDWRPKANATSYARSDGRDHKKLTDRLNSFSLSFASSRSVEFFESKDIDKEQVTLNRLPSETTKEQTSITTDDIIYRNKSIRRKFTDRIASETGLAQDMFREMRGCGSFEDPRTGKTDYSNSDNKTYIPLFFDRSWRWVAGDDIYWLTHRECADGSAAFLYPITQLHSSRGAGDSAEISRDLKDESTNIGTICPMSLDACAFDIRVFGDDLVIWSSAANGVGVYDIVSNTMRMKRFGIPQGDIMDGAYMLEDREHLLVTFKNGQFLILRMADGSIALNGRYADDEIVVWLPDGRFDATAEGASFVAFQFPGRIGEYSFQQFDAKLRVEGLVDKVLSGTLEERPIELSPPPDLTATIDSEEPDSGDRIAVTAKARGVEPLARLQVFQDGLLTDTIPLERRGEEAEITRTVDRLPGSRWMSLLATDQASVVSLPMGRDLGPDADAKRRVHVLSIGIERFADDAIPQLDGPTTDAATFASSLERLAGATGTDVEIASKTLLLDEDASAERILAEAQRLVDSVPKGETIAIFYAGHGLQAPDGGYYLVPSAAKLDALQDTALPWAKLAAIVGEAKTRVAVFIDACQSGFAGSNLFATNDAAVGSILDAAPSGVVVFAASKGRQAAVESDEAKGGYFTRAIEAALVADRATTDRNGNGAIEISELYGAVKREVVMRTRGAQTPWIARNQMIGDFALF